MRIPELRRLITQSGEILADLVAEAVCTQGQPDGSDRAGIAKAPWLMKGGD
jgi:hypothetical protein